VGEHRRGRVAAACLLAAPAAVAHSPIEGIGDFYGGILHPALVPAHLLALVSLGLLLGQLGLDAMRVGYAAFLPALIAGLVAAGAGVSINSLELWLLTGSLVCGLLVAVRVPLPGSLAAVLAGAVGLAVGLDSSPDIAQPAAGQRRPGGVATARLAEGCRACGRLLGSRQRPAGIIAAVGGAGLNIAAVRAV